LNTLLIYHTIDINNAELCKLEAYVQATYPDHPLLMSTWMTKNCPAPEK